MIVAGLLFSFGKSLIKCLFTRIRFHVNLGKVAFFTGILFNINLSEVAVFAGIRFHINPVSHVMSCVCVPLRVLAMS